MHANAEADIPPQLDRPRAPPLVGVPPGRSNYPACSRVLTFGF
jgi:hypothetical protein